MDRTNVKVIGEMEDVLVRLSSNDKVCQVIDIMVVDIPDAYGLVLSRDWLAKLNGYFSSDWSHLWLPYKGSPNQIKIFKSEEERWMLVLRLTSNAGFSDFFLFFGLIVGVQTLI